jgi:Na+/H+ antiporter NhaD/arsenite permease-like protein
LFAAASRFHLERTAPMAVFAALLSNLVSNVPAVLVFKSFIPHLPDPTRAWLTLAMSSTLAGNLTILGSVANLIVIEHARRRNVAIGFWEYAKGGVPLTVLTLGIGIWMLN